MYSDEIDEKAKWILSKGSSIIWMGVYAAHQIPKTNDILKACRSMANLQTTQEFGAAFIANTDTADKEGEHWVVFYFPSQYHRSDTHAAYMFDPLGLGPRENGHFDWEQALKAWSPLTWSYNKVHIQKLGSKMCGELCLLWLYYKQLGRHLPFGCNTPDSLIQAHYNNMHVVGRLKRPLLMATPLVNV